MGLFSKGALVEGAPAGKKDLFMTDRSFIFVFSIEENEQRRTDKTNDHREVGTYFQQKRNSGHGDE